MSVDGIEPSTSVLSGQRSTTELHARVILRYEITVKYDLGLKTYVIGQTTVHPKTN